MGWFSANEETIKKEEDENQINNNVIVTNSQENPLTIHNIEIIVLLYIIAGIKVIEFLYFLYRRHTERQKKKYSPKGNDTA